MKYKIDKQYKANTSCFAYSDYNDKPRCLILNELYCQSNGCRFYKRKGEENMVTVKKSTVDANKFEKKMIGIIKLVKGMDMPENTRNILLGELRNIHTSCLEWEVPKTKEEDFRILEELAL